MSRTTTDKGATIGCSFIDLIRKKTMNPNNKDNVKSTGLSKKQKIVFAVSLCAIILSAIFFSVYALNSFNNSTATPTPSSSLPPSSSQPPSSISEPESISVSEPEEEIEELVVDFEELQAKNSDIYAYIEVPNTNISFPMFQHPTDNTHYLRKDINHNYSILGVIYTELYNAKDFSDNNTVIYGHDTLDGQMFGDLRYYYDEEYLKENREIIIHTPDGELTYKIFAAILYDNRHIAYTYNVADGTQTLEYIETLRANSDKENSTFLDDVVITEESQIITLSTCYGDWNDDRYLVTAILEE